MYGGVGMSAPPLHRVYRLCLHLSQAKNFKAKILILVITHMYYTCMLMPMIWSRPLSFVCFYLINEEGSGNKTTQAIT